MENNDKVIIDREKLEALEERNTDEIYKANQKLYRIERGNNDLKEKIKNLKKDSVITIEKQDFCGNCYGARSQKTTTYVPITHRELHDKLKELVKQNKKLKSRTLLDYILGRCR